MRLGLGTTSSARRGARGAGERLPAHEEQRRAADRPEERRTRLGNLTASSRSRYEDLVGDLPGVARRALGFLEIEFDEAVLGYDAHARGKRVRSPSYADVVKPLYRTAIGRWSRYERYLEPHLEALEPFVCAFGYA